MISGIGCIPYVALVTFSLLAFDLSSITGLNENPNAAFRIVFNGATSASGNNRLDNLVVEGQSLAVPEPSAMVLLGLGLSATIVRRISGRRKKGWIDVRD